jgi:hypothetical protein
MAVLCLRVSAPCLCLVDDFMACIDRRLVLIKAVPREDLDTATVRLSAFGRADTVYKAAGVSLLGTFIPLISNPNRDRTCVIDY